MNATVETPVLKPLSPRSVQVLFLVAGVAALLIGLLMSLPWLRPPIQDFIQLVQLMGVSAVVSLAVGLLAWRLKVWQRFRLGTGLALGYLFAGGLVFFNVWLTARFMFINEHDLALAEVLLIFSGLMMIAFGFLASSSVAEQADQLARMAQAVTHGDLAARVAVAGQNELSDTARAFNDMATRLEASAEQQRTLEALRRDLIAWTSHDLRTPLTAIRLRAEALADGVITEPERVQHYHAQICHEVSALSALIDDLFELSQLEAGRGQQLQMGVYSLNDLVSDTLERFRPLAEARGVTLTACATPDLEMVRMDPGKLGRALDNLVSNALRYTPTGGQVQICAERMVGGVQVEVSDTGEGIAEADLPRVFERFFRSERARHRADGESHGGLGLAIVRAIIEGHGGQVSVRSQPGRGATFTLRWPG